ncbi:peptidase C39, partial [Neisseria gonorrhoeae]
MEQKRRFAASLLLAAALPLCAHSFPFAEENPIAYGKVKIQSWKARRDFNIVKQDLDFSCGAASVATLLNNFYGQTLTEEEVLKKLGKEQMRASFEDMRRIMPDLG